MEAILFIVLGAALIVLLNWVRARYADFPAQAPQDYPGASGEFDIRQTLNGPMICEGIVYGPTGRVSSRFVADFDVHWTGAEGVMDEVFRYDDGSVQKRAWRLTLRNDGTFDAQAEDVVGIGQGVQSGDAVQLKYKFRLPESSGGHVLDTVDWMYLAPNGTIINRSQFRKFGIKVAELVATIRPVAQEMQDAA